MAVFCVSICGGDGYEGEGDLGGSREQGLKRIIDEEYCAVRAGCRLPAMASKRQEEEEETVLEHHKDGGYCTSTVRVEG